MSVEQPPLRQPVLEDLRGLRSFVGNGEAFWALPVAASIPETVVPLLGRLVS